MLLLPILCSCASSVSSPHKSMSPASGILVRLCLLVLRCLVRLAFALVLVSALSWLAVILVQPHFVQCGRFYVALIALLAKFFGVSLRFKRVHCVLKNCICNVSPDSVARVEVIKSSAVNAVGSSCLRSKFHPSRPRRTCRPDRSLCSCRSYSRPSRT